MRVALNMLHLVPGETGGSELYARRLVPALLEGASDFELVVLASTEAVPSLEAEPWGADVELVGLGFDARSRVAAGAGRADAAAEEIRRPRASIAAQPLHDRPGRAGRPAGDDDPRRDLQALSGDARRRPRQGLAGLVSVAARRSAARDRYFRGRKTDIVQLHRRPLDRIDVTYLGPGSREAATGRASRTPARARARCRADRPDRLGEAAAQEPRAPVRGVEPTCEGSRPRRSGVRDGVRGQTCAPGDCCRAVTESGSRAGSTTPSSTASTGRRPASSFPRSQRASVCLCSTPLCAGPVRPRTPRSLPEVAGDAALYFDPTTRTRSPGRSNSLSQIRSCEQGWLTRGRSGRSSSRGSRRRPRPSPPMNGRCRESPGLVGGPRPRLPASRRGLMLEIPREHGAALPHGVLLDDLLSLGDRVALDREAIQRLAGWSSTVEPALTFGGVSLAQVWEVELLAEVFLPRFASYEGFRSPWRAGTSPQSICRGWTRDGARACRLSLATSRSGSTATRIRRRATRACSRLRGSTRCRIGSPTSLWTRSGPPRAFAAPSTSRPTGISRPC